MNTETLTPSTFPADPIELHLGNTGQTQRSTNQSLGPLTRASITAEQMLGNGLYAAIVKMTRIACFRELAAGLGGLPGAGVSVHGLPA